MDDNHVFMFTLPNVWFIWFNVWFVVHLTGVPPPHPPPWVRGHMGQTVMHVR